jgi:hypothetical protein
MPGELLACDRVSSCFAAIRTLSVLVSLVPVSSVLADASGTIVFTQRFDGPMTIVNEVDWTYVRSTPSVAFSNQRVIWTGAGAQTGAAAPPCDRRLAGSDGLFYTSANDLVVGNWEPGTCGLPGQFWIFDPDQTDVVVDGPSNGSFAFHLQLHPNLEDFLATPALGGIACTDGGGAMRGCFGVYDHTPLTTSRLCLAPLESVTSEALQPVTFIADENNNMFVLFNDGTDVQFGGAGFASFNLHTTSSSACSVGMSMTELIPPAIEAAHSISWDPYLSDANDPVDPHSDFLVFANSRLSHIRVNDPGTPGATAALVSTVDMASEPVCDSLLPAGQNEFDQGAVTGDGIALVADESNGFLALVDYRQNTNGTILDGANTVCLTAFLHDGIDDIAPLTGLGARNTNLIFSSGFEDGEG